MKILSSQLNLLGRTAGVVLMLVTGFYCDSNKVSSQALVPEIDSFVENTQQSSNVVEIELLNSLNSMRDRFQLKTKRLSLEKCLAMGLKQNILLAAAYASIQKEQYYKISMQRENLPTLSLTSDTNFLGQIHEYENTTDYQQVVENINGRYSTVNKTSTSSSSTKGRWFGPELTLAWSFFQPAVWASVKAQDSVVAEEQLAFDITARSAVLQIQEAYYQLQSSLALIDAFEEIFRLNSQQVNLVESKYAAGLVNIGSVEQAKTQFYSQASELISYYDQYFENAALLAFVMNEPGDLIILPEGEMSEGVAWQLSLEETVKQALFLREEIQKFLQSERSSLWRARSAIREYLPVFSLSFNFLGEYTNGTYKSYPLPKIDQDYSFEQTSIGLNVTWDIFDGGVAAAEAASYKAAARHAAYEAEYTRFQVREQIRRAYSKYKLSNLNLKNSALNLSAAKKAYLVQVSRFRVGLSDMTSVVQAIQLLGQAIETRTDALLASNESVAELYRYSAQWPEGIEPLVDERESDLKLAD